MSSQSGLDITGLDMATSPTSSKRDSIFSRLVSPNGLPSSPSPRSHRTSEYWGSSTASTRSPTASWQPPVSQHSSSPLNSPKSPSAPVSYLPMSYSPSSYSPVSQPSSAQSSPTGPYFEAKPKSSSSKRLSSMFSRFNGKKHSKKKATKVREETEYEEVKDHNDWMDEDY